MCIGDGIDGGTLLGQDGASCPSLLRQCHTPEYKLVSRSRLQEAMKRK